MLPEELLAEANGALTSTRRDCASSRRSLARASTPRSAAARSRCSTPPPSRRRRFFLSRMRVREEKPAPPEHHFVARGDAGHRATSGRRCRCARSCSGSTVALLVVGFTETLIFSVIAALGKSPSFFGVFATIQGVGSIVGGVTAAAMLRRIGERAAVGDRARAVRRRATCCLIVPSLAGRARRRPGRRRRRRLGDRRLHDGAADDARRSRSRAASPQPPTSRSRSRRRSRSRPARCSRRSSTTGSSSRSWRSWSCASAGYLLTRGERGAAAAPATMEA